jgi:fatty acid desaturase
VGACSLSQVRACETTTGHLVVPNIADWPRTIGRNFFYLGYWMLPVLITFAPYYGRVIAELVNQPQHIGLADNVPDYRLCCRTVTHNRFLEFLSWYMTYHTEHNMYATVPCYNLPKLHRMIKHDMPYCPSGILSAWTQIIKILKKQKPIRSINILLSFRSCTIYFGPN